MWDINGTRVYSLRRADSFTDADGMTSLGMTRFDVLGEGTPQRVHGRPSLMKSGAWR